NSANPPCRPPTPATTSSCPIPGGTTKIRPRSWNRVT
ncbi:uncharacterized protein METZ01_LOCUS437872, partial [marine metagenome]